MTEECKGVWVDENTFVEKDGTTHKAVSMETNGICSLLKICNTTNSYIPCRPEDRSDGKHVMFAIVQKIEVDKCK